MRLAEFLRHCTSFIGQSRRENKHWSLVNEAGGSFLKLTKTIAVHRLLETSASVVENSISDLSTGTDPSIASVRGDALCSIEYHVIFNESYGVPVLLFNIYTPHRGKMNMQEAWNVLELCIESNPSRQYETLTMVEHPVLFRPFLCLHPCKTMDILSGLESQNPIITFLSTYGRFVSLHAADLPAFETEQCG